MFGIPRFGQDRIREILHRFGPHNSRRTPLAPERPAREWRREGEARLAEDEKEKDKEGQKS